tara:strand:- start:753 stop:1388 length:636 start_codon:yes stop_codon:yes gene_type:complete
MTNATEKRTLLLVPMKDPEKSKTRLRDTLNLKDRAYLAKSLFKRTLQILKIVANNNASLRLDLAVISASPEIIDLSKSNKLLSILETGTQSLKNATEIAKVWATNKGYRSICILPADLANPDPEEIISFLKEANGNRFVTLSPSADLGTNALHISLPTNFNFRYGKKSFLRHIKAAEKLGVRPKILPLPSLKYDIDTSNDLKYLQGLELET